MRTVSIAAAGMLALSPIAASAQALVDLGDVKTVAGLLMQAGYKAEIKQSKAGDPFISSAANGSSFTLTFYGCKNAIGCDSFDISSWYKKEPFFSVAMANEWNAEKRFLKIAIDGDGDLVEYVYVSAVGKSTFKNFADYIDWYTSMDGALTKFLREKRDAAAAPAK